MRVIVGTAVRTPTPLFIGQMLYLEFNPYWNVPPSILSNEILPKLARHPRYLQQNDMEVVAADGQVLRLSPDATLGILRRGEARVRQRPGERNVLGEVKFAMPNPMNIYLHSTSSKGLFNRTRRDLSHGCIRVERPAELAQFVLADSRRWDAAAVAAAMAPGDMRIVRLPKPVPVVLFYATALVDRNGSALFAPDIYRQDDALARQLAMM
jgi:L,D-transpeptidase YcbB